MKKCFILIGIIILYVFVSQTKTVASMIPEEAIRLRVIPNSNDTYDQQIKAQVKDVVQSDLYQLLKSTKGINEARTKIKTELPNLEKKVSDTLTSANYQKGYQINFGRNYFPEKTYKGITYDEGYYESLVVTLGEGEGDNWWCVLFPPLCVMEADESSNDIEYKFFIQELIEKYL